MQGNYAALDRWFARFGREVVGQHPRLALASTWFSVFMERSDVADKLTLARHAVGIAATGVTASAQGMAEWQLELMVLEAGMATMSMDLDRAHELAQQVLDAAPAESTLARATSHFIVAIYHRHRGETDAAIEQANLAIAGYTRIDCLPGQLSVFRTKALLLYDAGRGVEAVHTFRSQLAFAQEFAGHFGGELAYSNMYFGILLYALDQTAEARTQFETLLDFAVRIGDGALALLAQLWLRLCAYTRAPAQPSAAEIAAEHAELQSLCAERSPTLQGQAAWATVFCRLREHNAEAAWSAAQCTAYVVRKPPTIGHMHLFLAYMFAYVARGRGLAAVQEICAEWEATLDRSHGLLPIKIRFLLLRSRLWLGMGNHNAALKALDAVLALIAQSGYIRFALDQVDELRPLLLRSRHPMAQQLLAEAAAVEAVRPRLASVPLTEVELSVLRLLASGHSRQEIAATLVISENTVKTHLRRIYAKLAVGSRKAALLRAAELGLLVH
jgi:LuxR family maltose regulon positive regulatory protein